MTSSPENTSPSTDPRPEHSEAAAKAKHQPPFTVAASRQFVPWLQEHKLSLVFTTYQAGKIFLVGTLPGGRLAIEERSIPRCMGMTVSGNSLYVSSLYQLYRFENALQPDQKHGDYDRLFVPKMSWITGDIDIHDMAVDASGRLVFVNTLFSCLATTHDAYSFQPIWQPPFISHLGPEDRCHLNGMAMRDGEPAFVTAVSRSDVADGWRDHRQDGGLVLDVATGEAIAEGLSMPHSPRWYQGKLWLCHSGTGQFGFVDLDSGKFEAVCFIPGYMRGLTFFKNFAIIGMSRQRENKTFSGLALDQALADRAAEPRCGLAVVDLETGSLVHNLRLEGVVRELYDVAVLTDVIRPGAIGFKSDEIRRVITLPPANPR
jgi:uncharacterized protein (TIGR03032 family)